MYAAHELHHVAFSLLCTSVQDFDGSESDSDRSDSVTDSAFIYKAQAAQKFAAGGLGNPEFDRMSHRLEKDLGLGNDMDSLISVERGGTDYAQVSVVFWFALLLKRVSNAEMCR